MAASPIVIAINIAKAMNCTYGTHIVINTKQFFGGEGNIVKMYIVKDSYYYSGKYSDKQIFKSASGVYTALFMRDMLYAFQGKSAVDSGNEGYYRVFAKNSGQDSIEYMKGAYLNVEPEDFGE